MLHALHTVLVIGAALIAALLGSVLFAPLASELLPTADLTGREDRCACTKPD